MSIFAFKQVYDAINGKIEPYLKRFFFVDFHANENAQHEESVVEITSIDSGRA